MMFWMAYQVDWPVQYVLIKGAVIAASFIPDAGSACERPRVLLADDHPAMHALAGEYLVVGSGGRWTRTAR